MICDSCKYCVQELVERFQGHSLYQIADCRKIDDLTDDEVNKWFDDTLEECEQYVEYQEDE